MAETRISVSIPEGTELLSLSMRREGWQVVLRCDPSVVDITGSSLFGTTSISAGKGTPQEAVDDAAFKLAGILEDINRMALFRKTQPSFQTQVEELSSLLGL